VRVEALARRPADGLRRMADPILFALATQMLTHAIWKGFGLPEAGLRVVLEVAVFGFALGRIAAIGRLARLYPVAVAPKRQPSSFAGSSFGTRAWMIARATRYVDEAMRKTGT
jgi:hypothetical protein